AGVSAGHNALRTEASGGFADEIGAGVTSRIDRDLIRAYFEQSTDLFDVGDASANGERHKAFSRKFLDGVILRGAAIRGGGDIEQDELIDLSCVINLD